ncbi:S9 family peptidase [Vallicoccus soli]|uniref:S9 family peptidase n=1 Tax=Vallicoccus soli TaxID=2339232 RepID=A0A3A3Z2B1_9ACTN|nr:DPP IV N-terminal domain-containing protein [Vallicoccus soli]RJK98400.1 S9 family peptidase [Vallicoccus soli]
MTTTPQGQTSYPRQSARTQRFTLGAPRAATPAPDGSRVAFLRSRGGTDRVTCLWTVDPATGAEVLVADPSALLASGEEELSAEERARRERTREGAGGVVGYATDREVRTAAFALSSRLFVSDLVAGTTRELEAAGPVIDPRPDPTGRRVAWVARGALHVAGVDGSDPRVLVEPDGDDVTWGLAEFVASEEMGRYRGTWWAPDGERLLVARVDESPVQRWHIADPEHPERRPAEVAYPAAGTPNADVRLFLVDLDGARTEVAWDRAAHEYLTTAHWSSHGDPLVQVQSRDQRRVQVLAVDAGTGATRVVAEDADDAWLELVAGVPAWSPDGRLVRTVDRDGARRLVAGDDVLTPADLQVQAVLDVDEQGVLVAASDEPTERHLWLAGWDGSLSRLTSGSGLHGGRLGGGLLVVAASSLERAGTRTVVHTLDGVDGPGTEIPSYAAVPDLVPRVTLLRAAERDLRTALVLPTGYDPAQGPLPVLMDPYGGPGAQRVLAARSAYLSSQWFADQGFAVVVVDGRGTPGRGPAWEREIAYDLAGPVLEDQVDALHSLAEDHPELDLSRVGVRGWSFGGYLAALAVLRRPDVFHAAVAGAPVTDWALYDTHYTERYLGTPASHPAAYAGSSIVDEAHRLERPLMVIHGLADDNVVAAHSLRLSSALLAAGRPHTVLPLSGVTHMTPQEVVAENLLLLQVRFLEEALARREG